MKNCFVLPTACMAVLLGSAVSLHSQTTIESTLGLALAPFDAQKLNYFAGDSSGQYEWAAMPFMTGSQAYSLSSITAQLRLYGGADLGVQINVYAADSIYNVVNLASPVGTFSTGSVPSNINTNVTFTSAGPAPTLNASTRYVAVMQTTSALGYRIYEWEWSANPYVTATDWTVPARAYGNWWTATPTGNWGLYYTDDRTMLATFTGTAIPEPSTYAALAGLAALGFAAYRRRRRQAV